MDHQDKKCLLREKLKVERVTPQRVLIYDIVKDIKKHMHVEEIYELARKKYPKINLATVYRTLKEFKKAGVVDELHLEQDHHHYESA
ncbi:transcriptional repressor, partial [Candidatus Woesearchaeota archaeon CG10_big_fil_rev_8_21_14_0_10_34_8]